MDLLSNSMDGKEPFMFQFQDVSLMGDEFMVVPSLLDESGQIQQVQTPLVDEFLLEANFAGVTGSILSPPSDHFNLTESFCTSLNDGRRVDDDVRTNETIFNQNSSTFQSKEFIFDESNFGIADGAAATVVDGNSNYFVDNFDFDGGDQGQNQVETQPQTEIIWEGQVELRDEEKVFNELEDPGSTWLSETTDLAYIEKMTSENEQQSQLLDELLRSDDLFPTELDPEVEDEADPSTDDSGEMEVEDVADEILNEIYHEAQKLNPFQNLRQNLMDWNQQSLRMNQTVGQRQEPGVAPVLPATIPKYASSAVAKGSMSRHVTVAPKIQKQSIPVEFPRYHLADHDFGAARRGRPPGSTSKRRSIPKRELKTKKRDQNREAALRYRLKKRAEKVEKDSELGQMEKRNQQLKNEKCSLAAEVKYLKELLIEIRKLKGYE